MKKLLALVLTVGMLTVPATQYAWYRQDEGGVEEVAKAPFRATRDVAEGTGKILTGDRLRDDGRRDWNRPDEGGVEEVAKAPFRATRDVAEGTGKILTGDWF